MGRDHGAALMDTMVVLVILGLTLAIVAPNLGRFRQTVDLRRLGRQVANDAMLCRMAALTSSRRVGLIFAREADRLFYCMVEDRDLDGVSRRDYVAGVDKPVSPRRWVAFLSGSAQLGVPDWRVPDPSGRGTLAPDDGLRLGDAAIMSFSPQAHATPSTVYFHDGSERMIAIRVAGRDGRIRVLEWQRGWLRWHDLKGY